MNIHLNKLMKAALIGGGLALATVSAQAQSASNGNMVVLSGPGAKAAHADQVGVNVDDRNLTISGGVADGVRIGDSKVQTGVQGSASVPVPTPSHPIPVPTLNQATAPVIAPVQAVRKIFHF